MTFEGTGRATTRRRHLISGLKIRRGSESPPAWAAGDGRALGAEAHPEQDPGALSGGVRRTRASRLRMIPYPPSRPLDLAGRPVPRG